MKKNLLLFVTILFSSGILLSQERYLDPVFNNVKIDRAVTYGINATILLQKIVGQAIPQPLVMDVYSPEGDTRTDRPLVLYFHTGNFLPYPQNMSVSGTRTDSSVVEICTRLAKMGYVVASCDYRLGWDPTNTSKDFRVFTLINAAYRGIQDARTAIRYFKKSVAESNNPFGIDSSKIVLWGQGTGGYVSVNCSALDNYIKIPTASEGKFLISIGGNVVPMIIPAIHGDIYGTSVGIVPPELAPILQLPAGDTLCYPNHVGYNSDFNLAVNMGGAIADTGWLDPGQKPVISIHTTNDPFAPYVEGIVLVPVTPPLEVVKVQGSYLIQKLSNEYGNNNFSTQAQLFKDVHTQAANALNDGYEGLYPILRANRFDSSPWDFWASTNINDTIGRKTNPDMSPEKARLFIDTIIAYTAPRACLALGLNCDLGRYTGTKNLDPASVGLEIVPNPAQDVIHISTYSDFPIESAYVMDINGKCFRTIEKVNSNQLTINRSNLNSGMYIIKLQFEKGEAYSKVIFK